MSCDFVGGTRPYSELLPFFGSHYVQISRRLDGRTGKHSTTEYHVCAYERLEKEEGPVNHLRPIGHADFSVPKNATIDDFCARVNKAIAEMGKKKETP